jgi:hypothetical protein
MQTRESIRRRAKKLKLILAANPNWADLSREWEECAPKILIVDKWRSLND